MILPHDVVTSYVPRVEIHNLKHSRYVNSACV